LANSFVIIPPSQTKDVARNLAETIMIIHNIPNPTNLIQSFMESSLSDVIILYPPMKATAIQITIKIFTA
jgi:hypothetical protein